MAKKPSQMTPAEYRASLIAKRKKKKDARINASEFANLGSATGMQKQTNKARNEGRYVNLGGGNAMKPRGADPSNLAGKGGRGTGQNLARKAKTPDEMATAAKKKRDITARVTAAEKRSKANRANSQGGRTAAQTKGSAKNFNVGVSKGGVSFKEAFAHFRKKGNKTFTWNGNKYTTQTKAEVAKKTTAPKKAAPKKGVSTYDEVKPQKNRKPAPKKKSNNAPNVGLGKMKTLGGLPVGAKPFKGSYNSKTHKLTKINGKMYTVPKK